MNIDKMEMGTGRLQLYAISGFEDRMIGVGRGKVAGTMGGDTGRQRHSREAELLSNINISRDWLCVGLR